MSETEDHDFRDDDPIRLATAAKIAFKDGSMKISGLRKEAERGNLETEKIAGKVYTTLGAVKRMREKCRVEAKDRASTSKQEQTETRSGSLETKAVLERAQAAARLTAQTLKNSSRNTSPQSTSPKPRKSAAPIRFPSQT